MLDGLRTNFSSRYQQEVDNSSMADTNTVDAEEKKVMNPVDEKVVVILFDKCIYMHGIELSLSLKLVTFPTAVAPFSNLISRDSPETCLNMVQT